MSLETGGASGEFLRMPATAKIEHLKTSKVRQEDKALVAAQIEPGEDRFIGEVFLEGRAFSRTQEKLQRLFETRLSQSGIPDGSLRQEPEAQILPKRVARPDEEQLTSAQIKQKAESLPQRAEEISKTSKQALSEQIAELVTTIKTFQISSTDDVDRLNELLEALTVELGVVGRQHQFLLGASQEADRMVEAYRTKALDEQGFLTEKGLDEAYKEVQGKMREKMEELRSMGTFGRIRNGKRVAELETEYRTLLNLSQTQYFHLSMPYYSDYELPSEIEKVIGETGGVVIDKVVTRENQMVGRAFPQQSEGEEPRTELLDKEVIDSLNRTYIERTVIAAILEKRETYTSLVQGWNEYQTQLEELSEPNLLEEVRAIALEAYAATPRIQRSFWDLQAEPQQEVEDQIPGFIQRINALPEAAREIVKPILQDQIGKNSQYQKMALLVDEYSHKKRLAAVTEVYSGILEEFSELANSSNSPAMVSIRRSKIASELERLEGLDFQAKIIQFIEKRDEQRWEIFRESQAAREALPAGALESFDQAAGSTIRSGLIQGRAHENKTITLGMQLLDYKTPADVPLVILNAFREVGYSGEYPFISIHHPNDRDTLLYKYIERLTPEDIDALEREDIPGLVETVLLIRDHPDSFRYPTRYDSEAKGQVSNPVGAEVQKNLSRVAAHYLEHGDSNQRYFVLGALLRSEQLSPEVYSSIGRIMGGGDGDMAKFNEEAASMLGERANHRNDLLALQTLRNYLNVATDTKQLEGGIEQVVRIAESIERGRVMDRGAVRNIPAYVEWVSEVEGIGIGLIQRAVKGELTLKSVEDLVVLFDHLGTNPAEISSFMSSEYFRGNLINLFQISIGSFELVMTRVLLNRVDRFGDETAFSNLLEVMSTLTTPSVRSNMSRAVASRILHDFGEVEDGGEVELRLLDRMISLLDSPDIALQRQAAQIMTEISTNRRFLVSDGMVKISQKNKRFYEQVKARLAGSATSKLRANEDPVVRYYLIGLENNLGTEIPSVDLLLKTLPFYKEIEAYQPGAGLSMVETAKGLARHFSPEQVSQILEMPNVDMGLIILLSLYNKLNPAQEQKLIASSDYAGIKIPEVFGNGLKYLLDDETELTEDNWMRKLLGYVIVKGNESLRVPQEKRDLLLGIFAPQNSQEKNFCLQRLRQMWMGYLQDPEARSIPAQAFALGNAVFSADLPANLRFIESYGFMFHQINKSFSSPHTTSRTVKEVKALLLAQEQRFARDRWSEEDRAIYQDISADILRAAPSLFAEFQGLISNFSADEMKRFAREFYPFYQAQLVVIQRGNNDNVSYDPRSLVEFRRGVSAFSEALAQAGEDKVKRAAVFEEQKHNIVEFLKVGFKARFGLLKVPEVIEQSEIRSIQNFIRYLGNIAHRDADKETLIAFFLGLQLNGRWEAFRRGEAIAASDYFEGEKLKVIEGFLSRRAAWDQISAEKLGLSSEQYLEFMAILQDETLNTLTGNVQTIDQKLGNVIRNLEALADPDIYEGTIDGPLLAVLRTRGKLVGGVLAKTWQQLSGKNIPLSEGEMQTRDELSRIEGLDLSTPESIKAIQDRIAPLRLISSIVNYAEEEKISEKIEQLQEKLNPPMEVVEIFKGLGEEFTPSSGALALSQDLMYLENVIVKSDDKLTPEQKEQLQEYLGGIQGQMKVLEATMQDVVTRFETIKKSSETSSNERLKARLVEIDRAIYARDEATSIMTRLTIDPNLIIENMRQCLGMMSQEINNDTNLTFGDTGKFFMMSQIPGEKVSVSDQIVFFVPTADPLTGEPKEFSFVMDQVYGAKSSDVLVSHVLTVTKKLAQLKERFPSIPLRVFVTNAAMSSGGLTFELLSERLHQQLNNKSYSMFSDTTSVVIPRSASGDHYVEFGGGVRTAGPREVTGLSILVI